MSAADPRSATARLTIDLDALVANWRFMSKKCETVEASAVVKADAYGLGLEPVSKALADAGCSTFFVAVPDEAVRLRCALPDPEIFVLSGVFDAESAEALAGIRAIPVLNSLEQIDIWSRAAAHQPCAIHADTGMNRLGLTVDEALAFAERNAREKLVRPVLLMSHLACADDPAHPLNQKQLQSFQRVRAAFPDVESSLANSAGIFLGPDYHFDLTRPGIALYGGAAVNGITNPMRPVVKAEARILQIRHAKVGETVSYGASVTLRRDTVIAAAGCGYADGFHRAGSGSGVPLRRVQPQGAQGFVAGQRVPVIGRISMDLTLFDVTEVPEQALLADARWIELFGPNIALDEAAAAAGTIGYEMLTSLGSRYCRSYGSF